MNLYFTYCVFVGAARIPTCDLLAAERVCLDVPVLWGALEPYLISENPIQCDTIVVILLIYLSHFCLIA